MVIYVSAGAIYLLALTRYKEKRGMSLGPIGVLVSASLIIGLTYTQFGLFAALLLALFLVTITSLALTKAIPGSMVRFLARSMYYQEDSRRIELSGRLWTVREFFSLGILTSRNT